MIMSVAMINNNALCNLILIINLKPENMAVLPPGTCLLIAMLPIYKTVSFFTDSIWHNISKYEGNLVLFLLALIGTKNGEGNGKNFDLEKS